MSTAENMPSVSVPDYLDGEHQASTKHEYVDGRIYAMAGGRNAHNRVASRVLGALYRQLDGPCEAYNSDTKIRICHQGATYFYYPDVSVVCDPNPDDDVFQDKPVVIVEVLSESTRRIDEGEKRDTCFLIDSLQAYVLLEADKAQAIVYQRTPSGEFEPTAFLGNETIIPLPGINAELRLKEAYS